MSGFGNALGADEDLQETSVSDYSTFVESIGDGGGVRIFLEPRELPITHGEYVGEVTLPLPACGLDMPCIVTQRHYLAAA